MPNSTPRDPIGFINKNFDWEAYVQEHYSFKPARQDTEMRIDCPYDDCDDTGNKMYVNPGKKMYHCFKCKRGSRKDGCPPVSFVMLTEDVNYMQAVQQLMADLSETAVEYEDIEEELENWEDEKEGYVPRQQIRFIDGLPQEAIPLKDFNSPIQKPFFRYLVGRGLTFKEITGMQVHCVPKTAVEIRDSEGNFKGDVGKRIIWPIYGGNPAGLVSWDARETPMKELGFSKYMKCPDGDHAHSVWPYVPPYGDKAVLVEGIIDCYAVRRIPKTSGYATFTKQISEQQVALLKRWGVKEVILAWDIGNAKPQMIKAVEDLKLHFKVFVAAQEPFSGDMDCGDTLRMGEGTSVLRKALKPIDVYSWDYTIWCGNG